MDLIKEDVFNKTFDSVVKVLPIPDLAEESIIATKNFLRNDDVREKIKEIFNNTINKDGKIVENVIDIKKVLKEEGIKEGISKAIDIVIDNLKKTKQLDKNTAKTLKNSKEYIIDKAINNEIEDRLKGQEKVLKNINKKYLLWEEELNKMNIGKMDNLYNQIKNEYTKLMPTLEIINKVKQMDNLVLLAKNKIQNGENTISDLEKEICRKAG